MKASKFSDAQKAFVLRRGADGVPVADICRKAGISPATYFNWKKKYDGMQPPEMRRLKQLEDENAKLKKIVVDLSLDREMLRARRSRLQLQTPARMAGPLVVDYPGRLHRPGRSEIASHRPLTAFFTVDHLNSALTPTHATSLCRI
jgi:putative transposase